MLDVKNMQATTTRVTPKLETLLGELCQSLQALDVALNQIEFLEVHRYSDHANFHNHDASMPDVTLGEMMTWIINFACEEAPQMVRQQPAGQALVKARARQLLSMLKPMAVRVAAIAESPTYRGTQPFLFTSLAHPKVFWAVEEAYDKLKLLANQA